MPDPINIITDHKWKNFLYGNQLTPKERNEFDHLSEEEINNGTFIRYCNRVYCLDDFMLIDEKDPFHLFGYVGSYGNSFFSGVIIKISSCVEQYQIATYIA